LTLIPFSCKIYTYTEEKEENMNLSIGTKVRWESAAGVKRGTIKNVVLSPAANGVITPWIDVESLVQISDMYELKSVRLCASDGNLKAMRVALVA
jgi:hypothetical protein